ncbi:MAG TPA: MgtC/SapB family protein [Candidatus Paceibacterota bacterium]
MWGFGFEGGATEMTAVWQILLALILGACIGLERSVAGKNAGMRTYALVSMGSCLLTSLTVLVAPRYLGIGDVDPFRIAAAIVMGIGFIGTGLVIHKGEHPVGLTTAAGIWVTAAIGITVGFELYLLAINAAILTLFIFTVLSFVETKLEKKFARSTSD